jgi:hypothetical protein
MGARRYINDRWTCPHCKAEGWTVRGGLVNARFDHARPDGRTCQRAARDGRKLLAHKLAVAKAWRRTRRLRRKQSKAFTKGARHGR